MRARFLVALAAIAIGLPAVGGVASVASAAPDDTAPAYSQTKNLTRSIVFDGQQIEIDNRSVTVTASRTTELRGRERIQIEWTGAHPSGGRAGSPFGELGMLQEYPVVIMQCRGVDDPTLPLEQQLAPETCGSRGEFKVHGPTPSVIAAGRARIVGPRRACLTQ